MYIYIYISKKVCMYNINNSILYNYMLFEI